MAATNAAPQTPKRRRTAAETRQVLLDAGTQLVVDSLKAKEAAGGGPLAHIRVQDVVRKASATHGAPITTGALYNLWPNQRAFQVDLMFHMLREGAYPSAEPTLRLAGELFAERLPFEVVGTRLCDESFRIEAENPVTRASMAFLALADVPEVREALRAAQDTLVESAVPLYTQVLKYGGLRMREPYTLEQLIMVTSALSGGLLNSYGIVPEQFDVPEGTRSIVATATWGIFDAFCEPDE